jgi:hypothetical protein
MTRSFLKSPLLLGLIACTALTVAASAAQDEKTSGDAVSFVNTGNRRIELYTRYGSDASCGKRPKRQVVSIAPEQTVTVDAGGSSVCFCLQVPERGTCATGWTEVTAGGTRRLG